MKFVLPSVLILSLISPSTFALNVDAGAVQVAQAPAERLSAIDAATLRIKMAWTRLVLLQIEKNERVFQLADSGPGGRKRVAIGISNTVVDLGLMAATGKYAVDAVGTDIKGPKEMHSDAMNLYRKEATEIPARIRDLQASVESGGLSKDAAAALINPLKKKEALATEMLAARRKSLGITPIQRTARGLSLVLAAGLVVTLAKDIGVTWAQIEMDPNDFAQKKADLEAFVRDGERRLADQAHAE